MSNIRAQVLEFHRAFGCPSAESPTVPSGERVKLRLRLIAEEFFELLDSCRVPLIANGGGVLRDEVMTAIGYAQAFNVDLPDIADDLADLDYVIEGTRLEFGIDGAPIGAEVHRSNMSKLGDDGKPVLREDGKVTKGPNYSPPDVAGELRRQGWRE